MQTTTRLLAGGEKREKEYSTQTTNQKPIIEKQVVRKICTASRLTLTKLTSNLGIKTVKSTNSQVYYQLKTSQKENKILTRFQSDLWNTQLLP